MNNISSLRNVVVRKNNKGGFLYMSTISNWFRMALFENDSLSLTRLLSVSSWLLFAGVSLYLVLTNNVWNEYATFATLTGGGGAATQLVNKFTNSKYNTAPGSFNQQEHK